MILIKGNANNLKTLVCIPLLFEMKPIEINCTIKQCFILFCIYFRSYQTFESSLRNSHLFMQLLINLFDATDKQHKHNFSY